MNTTIASLDNHSQSDKLTYLVIVGLCYLAFLAGCGGTGIDVPPADPTPPTVTLSVIISGVFEDIVLTPTSSPIARAVEQDTTIKFLAVARDEDGGVKNITISGSATVSCTGGGLGQKVFLHYLASNPDPNDPEPGDRAITVRATAMHIDVSNLIGLCAEDFSLSDITGSFVATAENFHSGTATTAPFTFTVSP